MLFKNRRKSDSMEDNMRALCKVDKSIPIEQVKFDKATCMRTLGIGIRQKRLASGMTHEQLAIAFVNAVAPRTPWETVAITTRIKNMTHRLERFERAETWNERGTSWPVLDFFDYSVLMLCLDGAGR